MSKYRDLNQWNITREKLKEIVNAVILETDLKLFNQEEREKFGDFYLAALKRLFVYYLLGENEKQIIFNKGYLENKGLNDRIFNMRIQDAIRLEIIIRNILFYIRTEKEKQAFLNWIEFKAKQDNEKEIQFRDFALYLRETRRNSELSNDVKDFAKEKEILVAEILELGREIVRLEARIVENEARLKENRENYVNHLFTHANEIVYFENGIAIPVFEKNTEQEILGSFEEYAFIYEVFKRELLDLNIRKEQARNDFSARAQAQAAHVQAQADPASAPDPVFASVRSPSTFVYFPTNKINVKFKAEEQKVHERRLHKMKEVYVKYNIFDINENTPIEEVRKKLKIIEDSPIVKESRLKLDVSIETIHIKINDDKQEIIVHKEEMATKEKIVDAMEKKTELDRIRTEFQETKTEKRKNVSGKEKGEAVKEQEVQSKETAVQSKKMAIEITETTLTVEKTAESSQHTAHETEESSEILDQAEDDFDSLLGDPDFLADNDIPPVTEGRSSLGRKLEELIIDPDPKSPAPRK